MKRKLELNNMSAIACLLVILIHVLSVGIVEVNPVSWQAVVIYFPWRLAAFVVPVFIYIAAVKLAGQFGDMDISLGLYLRYILRRIRKVYIPYVLWTAVYYAVYLRFGYVAGSVREFLSYVWMGNIASPFYFIIVIMQFYLTMPVWIWILRHVHPVVGIAASLLASLCMFLCPYTDRICLTYCVFWAGGLYAGKYYDRLLPVLRARWTALFCGGGIAVYGVLFYWQYAFGFALREAEGIKIAADCLSILLLHAVCLRLSEKTGWAANLLEKVFRCSFSVYLSHCLFLTLLEAFLPQLGITRISAVLIIRGLVCYTMPFLLHLFVEKICRYKE